MAGRAALAQTHSHLIKQMLRAALCVTVWGTRRGGCAYIASLRRWCLLECAVRSQDDTVVDGFVWTIHSHSNAWKRNNGNFHGVTWSIRTNSTRLHQRSGRFGRHRDALFQLNYEPSLWVLTTASTCLVHHWKPIDEQLVIGSVNSRGLEGACSDLACSRVCLFGRNWTDMYVCYEVCPCLVVFGNDVVDKK